jgi:hypothetical protein
MVSRGEAFWPCAIPKTVLAQNRPTKILPAELRFVVLIEEMPKLFKSGFT